MTSRVAACAVGNAEAGAKDIDIVSAALGSSEKGRTRHGKGQRAVTTEFEARYPLRLRRRQCQTIKFRQDRITQCKRCNLDGDFVRLIGWRQAFGSEEPHRVPIEATAQIRHDVHREDAHADAALRPQPLPEGGREIARLGKTC